MGNVIKTFLLVTDKPWHDTLLEELKNETPHRWLRFRDKESFTEANLSEIKPDLIFIPHWSHIIPESVYLKFECIVFHMTDLPYGRGGSPLQNLITRGHKETKISAIRVAQGIDTGPVYLKAPLTLEGTSEEIFIRSTGVIKSMILEIIEKTPVPVAQEGEPVVFKRRKPEESDIKKLSTIEEVYDYIRMLDADGYPKAFLETENLRLEFSKASIENDQTLNAHVRIFKK